MDIVDGTSVDGPGLRTAIYTAGCAHACPGCHNPSTWAFDAGHNASVEDILKRVRINDFNVTLTGGDPMYQAKALVPLCDAIRACGYSIWCYTGFTFEQLLEHEDMAQLVRLVDVIVDGPFVQAQRNTDLFFRGSENQRIIDVAESLKAGHAVLAERYYEPSARL